MKIRPIEAELFHADGQTDRHMKLTVAFRDFANAPKSEISLINELFPAVFPSQFFLRKF
jgi:hypothetical protein